MHLLRLTLPTIAANLACDEALLLAAEDGSGGEVLRFWEIPTPAVVLGAAGKLAEDVDVAACDRDNIPIARRASGGGTVLLGPGCLLFSLVLSYERAEELTQIGSSYAYILNKVAKALEPLLPGVERAGTSDLAIGGRKFSGNSQQRKRTHLLHHGTLLVAFNLATVGCYLCQPVRQPDYRLGRDHDDFLMNLPLSRESFERYFCAEWQANPAATVPEALMAQLLVDKYSSDAWIRRR